MVAPEVCAGKATVCSELSGLLWELEDNVASSADKKALAGQASEGSTDSIGCLSDSLY